MEVKLSQAVKMFYSKSSFDMIYLEAVANALDAGATNINITFEAKGLTRKDVKSFRLTIEDNGVGFTDERYAKFCKLMDVDELDKSHRGLGRLVYLTYFDSVIVESYYNETKYRKFSFDEKFDDASISDVCSQDSKSIITLSDCSIQRLHDGDFASPEWIRKHILRKYYSRLYAAKIAEKGITINITAKIGQSTITKQITPESIPEFKEKPFVSKYTTEGSMKLLYSVKSCDVSESSIITALAIDDRNESIDVFAKENIYPMYEMVFILFSDSFQGRIDDTRQNITFSDEQIKVLQRVFRDEIMEIIEECFPEKTRNIKAISDDLSDKFPHLASYFDNNKIGFNSKNEIIKEAQNKFFNDQRELLLMPNLASNDFEKALEVSGRALTEYILFRQLTINKLKKINKKDIEDKIHNIIVPRRTVLRSENCVENVYKNCSWILDDKFMTYSTVLSEKEMVDLLAELSDEKIECEGDKDRPDIAIIFSDDPKTTEKVEVVIIELKKKGLKAEVNAGVEVQLERRALNLAKIYPSKIQRLWLYGVTELDKMYRLHLRGAGYKPLYSKGISYVNTSNILVDEDTGEEIPAIRYVMDFDALIDDADARNKAFLDIIKGKFND